MSTQGWIPPDTFAERLFRARKGRKLTVEKAAAMAGLSAATWSTWERGAGPRDLVDVVQRVSSALDVDRDWLMWGGALVQPGQSAGAGIPRYTGDNAPAMTDNASGMALAA